LVELPQDIANRRRHISIKNRSPGRRLRPATRTGGDALAILDYAVVVFYLALMVGFGWYFSREQHTSKDFLLAGRSMGWFPIGLSVMATLISALSYTGVPAAAYGAGLKLLAWPLALWLTLPIVAGLVLPIYRNLEIVSIYEYLELRYNQTTDRRQRGVCVLAADLAGRRAVRALQGACRRGGARH
jgi:uncharacterized sodium:solute symporter family permease YidK